MKNEISAKMTWNRVSGEFTYKSINEFPKIRATFAEQNGIYVCIKLVVLDTEYSSVDLQNKLETISKKIKRDYSGFIK